MTDASNDNPDKQDTTAKAIMDKVWEIDPNKPTLGQINYTDWMDVMLLALYGNYFMQWLFGSSNAPSPLSSENKDQSVWEKEFPQNRFGQDFLAGNVALNADGARIKSLGK